jgi:S1-C subfamily serine protease
MHVPVNAFQERDAWNRMLKGEVWGHPPGRKPWLGVQGDPESKEAKIATVKEKSPAQRAELKSGDVIVAFDGKTVADFTALTQAVSECYPNESVMLRVRRGSDLLDIRVRLGEQRG